MLNSVNLNETGAITPVNSQNYNISYRGGTNSLERTPEADTYNKKKMGKGTKIALGTVGLAGVLIAIDRLALKGRYTDNILKWFKRNSDNVKPVGNDPKPQSRIAPDELTEEYLKSIEENKLIKKMESDRRNQQWLDNQYKKKEKEYSDFWNKELKEQEVKAKKELVAKKTKVLEGENVELVDGGNTFTLNKGEVVGYKNANGEDLLSKYKNPETDGDKAYKAIIEEKIAKIKTAELDPIKDGYDENLANEVIEILKKVK